MCTPCQKTIARRILQTDTSTDDEAFVDQLMIDLEENENSGYFPIQIFETQSKSRSVKMITVPNIPESNVPHDVVGWCSDDGGSICNVTAVAVGDSGLGQVMMIYGGDHGIRLRPSSSKSIWSVNATDQSGEAYVLLPISVDLIFHEK